MPKRRPKGEGSLYYNEKKKLWVAQINMEDGKTKTHYGKTQKEVRDWLLETRTARQRGLLLEEENITLSVFLDRYMEDVWVKFPGMVRSIVPLYETEVRGVGTLSRTADDLFA